MEQETTESLFELQVDYESGNHLKETIKWSHFLAMIFIIVVGLCFLIVSIVLLVALFVNPETMNNTTLGTNTTGGILQLLLLFPILACVIIAGIMLYRFASRCKQGIYNQDQVAFNSGLKALRNYFILYGVMAILGILGEGLKIFNSSF